ncbi:hypothetical protein O2K51_07040 [Apibacter raozihei]|uniref:hypothetical protein n=1 Tax=Apibacter raozihei TaxID=2500547 RepID=UPI000FE424CF|nr:hypothetical protein [Apibacter raozihei]
MRLFPLICLLVIILGCKNSETNNFFSNSRSTFSWEKKSLEKFDKKNLCKNQLSIINDKEKNLKFDLDSIKNGGTYFTLIHKNIRTNKSDHFDQKDVTFNIIPYTEINNITISLGKSIIKPRSSGYWIQHSERFLRIDFREKFIYWKSNYYSNFNKVFTNTHEEGIPPPAITLIMTDSDFAPIRPALINIYCGYLQAMEKHSIIFFHKNVCNLKTYQLDSLKKWFPLRIRITRNYKS